MLLWLAINALQTTSGQTWLAKKVMAYLSGELKTNIRIDRLKVHFGTSVDLVGLYVEDLHHDTLLYAGSLGVRIKRLEIKNKYLSLNSITLKDATFNLIRYKGEQHDNLAFITDYFAGDTTVMDTAPNPWKVLFDAHTNGIALSNVHFRHIVQDDSLYASRVDFSHLDVKDINGNFKGLHFSGDSAFVKIEKLRFTDHSGFRLNELSTDAKIAPDEMRLGQLTINTPTTDLHADITFKYHDFSCFDDFLTCIRFNSDFHHSKISFTDLALFTEDVKTMKLDVDLSGVFKGTVSNFKGKNVDIRFGARSFIKGDIAMNGLPDIEETFMEVDAREIRTNKRDLEAIRFPGVEPGNRIILPANTEKLGTVSFKGRFTGFYNDFVAYGNVKTDIGYVSTDINLKYKQKENQSYYSGHISTNNFDVGTFWSLPDFGTVTLSADIKGSGLTVDKMNAQLTGTIGSLNFRRYDYRDLHISANVSKKLFNGLLAIHEPNIDLDFEGKINFQDKLPVFNFTADLKSLQLDKLNLFSFRKDVNLSAKADIEFTGNKIDNLTGTIHINDINYREEKVLHHINELKLLSTIDNSGMRKVIFNSDNLDADFFGHFEFETLGDAFKQVMPRYLPSLLPLSKVVAARQDFDFNIRLKNFDLLTKLFMPGWYFDANTVLKGNFNSIKNSFYFKAESPEVHYTSIKMVDLVLEGNTDDRQITVNLGGERLYYSDSGYVEHPRLNAIASSDKVEFALHLADSAVYASNAFLKGALSFQNPQHFTLDFDSTHLVLNNTTWLLNAGSQVLFDSAAVTLNHFDLKKDVEKIELSGTLSKKPEDKIAVHLEKFDLINFNPFLRNSGTTLAGIADGTIFLQKGTTSNLMLQSDLTIDSVMLNGDTIGRAIVRSGYNNEDKILSLNATIQRGNAITLIMVGDYLTDKKQDNLNFDIRMSSIYLNTVSQYVSTVLTDLRGKVSADLKLTGSLEKPVLNGEVHLTKASCKVNYLGTSYSFTNDVQVSENAFILKNFSIHDQHGKEALVNGVISHNYFKKFVFDLSLRANDFECLNTTANQNSLYYGKAIASGYATFKGHLENMSIDIALSSRKGTTISVPLGGGGELSRNEFITFIKHNKDTIAIEEKKLWTNPSGVNLELAFNITPDAELQLIFDEKIGDIINGYGKGDIRMVVTDDGTFKMYGNYVIDKGTYLFTLRNVINKKFIVEKGGTITWTGDPYDADINMNATYRLYTSSLYNLINDSTYKKRIAVDCRLNLTNKLMNPTIRYAIDVPGVDGAAQTQISSVLNSDAEVSKQFFGLLVLNQFIAQGNSNQSTTAFDNSVGSNTAELLSNQVSNWLGQLNSDVSLAVNYKAKDQYSSDQVQLMVSKSFMNDRLTVDGTFGVYNSNSTQSANNPLGDFNAEYKVSADGRFRIKAFNHSNENYSVLYNAQYTQGLGVFYREEFDSLRELMIRWRLKKKDPTPAPATN